VTGVQTCALPISTALNLAIPQLQSKANPPFLMGGLDGISQFAEDYY
jgi:hypothetical protein